MPISIFFLSFLSRFIFIFFCLSGRERIDGRYRRALFQRAQSGSVPRKQQNYHCVHFKTVLHTVCSNWLLRYRRALSQRVQSGSVPRKQQNYHCVLFELYCTVCSIWESPEWVCAKETTKLSCVHNLNSILYCML